MKKKKKDGYYVYTAELSLACAQVGMLTTLELVQAEELRTMLARFDALDTGGGGTLGRNETTALLEKRAREVLALGTHP